MNKFNRERHKAAKKEMKKPVSRFEPIDLDQAPFVPQNMTRAFRNTRYFVMIFDNTPVTTGTAIKAMVQKLNDTPILNHWAEMQKIKNEIFGSETVAVEYYPAESQLIDEANIYWLWIFPDNILPLPI